MKKEVKTAGRLSMWQCKPDYCWSAMSTKQTNKQIKARLSANKDNKTRAEDLHPSGAHPSHCRADSQVVQWQLIVRCRPQQYMGSFISKPACVFLNRFKPHDGHQQPGSLCWWWGGGTFQVSAHCKTQSSISVIVWDASASSSQKEKHALDQSRPERRCNNWVDALQTNTQIKLDLLLKPCLD